MTRGKREEKGEAICYREQVSREEEKPASSRCQLSVTSRYSYWCTPLSNLSWFQLLHGLIQCLQLVPPQSPLLCSAPVAVIKWHNPKYQSDCTKPASLHVKHYHFASHGPNVAYIMLGELGTYLKHTWQRNTLLHGFHFVVLWFSKCEMRPTLYSEVQ